MFLLSKLLNKRSSVYRSPEPPEVVVKEDNEDDREEEDLDGEDEKEKEDTETDEDESPELVPHKKHKRLKLCRRESSTSASIETLSLDALSSKFFFNDYYKKRQNSLSAKTNSMPHKTNSLPSRLDTHNHLTKCSTALASGFLKLLCSILNEEEAKESIGYCSIKKLLIVYDVHKFTDYLVSSNKLLKASTFSQFLRQLLLRGFKEMTVISAKYPNLAVFTHPDHFVLILMAGCIVPMEEEECCRLC